MPILCCSKFCRTGNSYSESVPTMDGSPECERYIFYGKSIFLHPRFSLLEHAKAESVFAWRRVPQPLRGSHGTVSIHPWLHTLHLLTSYQQSHFLQIFGLDENPLKLQGRCNSHMAKHFMMWKLRFHLNLKPLFLINTAGCISFIFCFIFWMPNELHMDRRISLHQPWTYTRNFLGQ